MVIEKETQNRKRLPAKKIIQYRLYQLFPYIFLVLFALIFLFPILVMVSTSLKTMEEAFNGTGNLIPQKFEFSNYANVFATIPFFRYLGNTIYVSAMNVLGTVLVTPMVAYSLSKLKWKGRDPIFSVIIASMLIPYTATMIPLYKIWVKVQMVGTFWPLIIPAFFGSGFYIVLLRQFMLSIPDDLLDAAKIDGCGAWRRYTRIVLPLSKPGIATITIFSFMFTYSDFLGPLLYANSAEHYTLSLGLQSFMNEHSVEWTSLMAAATLFMLPLIILFLFAQKSFIEGISTSGLK
jgi:multiple sugar transport system permease protein